MMDSDPGEVINDRSVRLLTLLRHGQAEAAPPGGTDHDRALAERGHSDVRKIALRSVDQTRPPQRILYSQARRTVETAGVFRDTLSLDENSFIGRERLYLASVETLLAEIQEQDAEGVDHLMIIGHNPGLEQLAMHLDKRLGEPHWSMSTATLCRFLRPVDEPARLLLEERPGSRR